MTDQHPITPPPELIQQWLGEFFGCTVYGALSDSERYLATQAARWGADTELEACCEWFVRDWTDIETADKLRTARRPKPPSLKEQALAVLEDASNRLDAAHENIIRRALESLPD
jgi:hypothetical protein